jgi:glutathione S-transferase
MSSSSEAARKLLIGDKQLKLEYFAIEGAAEQVRIALSVADVPFDDATIDFSEWQTRKPTTKYGQLPEMTLPNGSIITESMAMLRLAGEADPEGKLYPTEMEARVKVEEVLGLVGDLSRGWRPSLYIGMLPQTMGYPPKDEWAEADATIEKLRTDFIANELPRYMGYFTDLIKENGGDSFLTGGDLTIADIAAYQQINYFRKGFADHVPKECLEPYSEVTGWLGRVEGHSKVAAYKASKAK